MATATIHAGIAFDGSKFTSGLAKTRTEARAFGSDMTGIGSQMARVFAVAGGTAMLKGMISDMSRLSDSAANLSITTDSLQALQAVAIGTGNDIEQVTTVMGKLKNAQADIAGNVKLADAFKRLGIGIDEIKTMAPDDLFARMGRAVVDAKDEQQAFNAVSEIFGAKIGPKMVDMLRESAAGMDALTKAAKDSGQIISVDMLQRADDLDKAFQQTGLQIKNWTASAIEFYAALLQGKSVADALSDAPAPAALKKTVQESIDREKAVKEIREKGAKDVAAMEEKTADTQGRTVILSERIAALQADISRLQLEGPTKAVELEQKIWDLKLRQIELSKAEADIRKQSASDVKQFEARRLTDQQRLDEFRKERELKGITGDDAKIAELERRIAADTTRQTPVDFKPNASPEMDREIDRLQKLRDAIIKTDDQSMADLFKVELELQNLIQKRDFSITLDIEPDDILKLEKLKADLEDMRTARNEKVLATAIPEIAVDSFTRMGGSLGPQMTKPVGSEALALQKQIYDMEQTAFAKNLKALQDLYRMIDRKPGGLPP